MDRNILEQAMEEVRDGYIHDAATFRKKRRISPWLAAVAAVLALCVCVTGLWRPSTEPDTVQPSVNKGSQPASGAHMLYALSSPIYPSMVRSPYLEENAGDYDLWRSDQKAMHTQPAGYGDNLQDYFSDSVSLLLGNANGQNAVCSPLSIYMAMAMLAQITDGESRAQILKLLNADSIEALQEQAGHIWRGHYNNDGLSTSILGTSLWLSEDYSCNEETARILAERYFASVFRGDLSSQEMNEALQSWLSEQTGGMLDEYVANVQMDPMTVLALASTVYYQVQWLGLFHEKYNTEGTFHGASQNTTAVFMNTTHPSMPYYWGEHFSAVAVALEDGSRMWLFLPDKGIPPEYLMSSGELFAFLAQDQQNKSTVVVNLSLPKFDIACQTNLTEQLQALGVTDVFQSGIADFSPIFQENDGGYISEVEHAARVAIDERGITAAAFTLILRAGGAMPPDEEIDFVLDRPFAFVIESQDNLPLFAGIVNQP